MARVPIAKHTETMPLVLADPVVRHIEPTVVNVCARDNETLTVLHGQTAVATGDSTNTVALSDQLHAVVTCAVVDQVMRASTRVRTA